MLLDRTQKLDELQSGRHYILFLAFFRTGLQDLTGKALQIELAYKVSSRGCRISRVGNYRSYMPIMYQEVTSGSHGFETADRTRL